MRKRIEFVLRQHDEVKDRLSPRPEKIPEQLLLRFPFYADYESEARTIARKVEVPFIKSDYFCVAMIELYQWGHHKSFGDLSIPIDLRKAAYWTMQAFMYNDRSTFLFLSRMVPICFVEDADVFLLLDKVKEARIEQARLIQSGESSTERRKREAVDDFVIDCLYQINDLDIDSAMVKVFSILEALDNEVELQPVLSRKAN